MTRIHAILTSCALSLMISACATPGFAPEMEMSDAQINPETVTEHSLKWLPGPRQSIPIAVYGVADETGAFKPTDSGQTLSRAVTQAPTPILLKALHDAGNRTWFNVIERENLNNIIKERQIIQEMRQRYLGETEINTNALPALKFAGILIEGAITGYDTNTRTGGAGARYLGVGGSTQYREDAVSVYLRAVSVKTGEVLLSITAQQRVASVSLQGDAFRFVSFQKLLEAEAGITLNQPRHMAVRQAMEKAVYGLIVEGAEIGLWTFDDPISGSAAIDHYRTNYAPIAETPEDGGLPKEFYAYHNKRTEIAQQMAQRVAMAKAQQVQQEKNRIKLALLEKEAAAKQTTGPVPRKRALRVLPPENVSTALNERVNAIISTELPLTFEKHYEEADATLMAATPTEEVKSRELPTIQAEEIPEDAQEPEFIEYASLAPESSAPPTLQKTPDTSQVTTQTSNWDSLSLDVDKVLNSLNSSISTLKRSFSNSAVQSLLSQSGGITAR